MLIPRAGQAQAASSGVFSTLQTDLVPDIGVALEPATMRSRVVNVDTQRITAARLGRESLTLNLFDDTAVAVQIDRVRPTRSGYFITGRPEGFEWGEVRLVVNGPVMVGTVVTPDGKYTIRFAGAGRHIIRQVDPSQEALADDVVATPLPPGPPQIVSPGSTVSSLPGPENVAIEELPDRPTEDGSEIRILFAYTPALLAQEGGVAGVQALIDLMIHTANHAFEISGIQDLQLVLVHSVLLDYVETDTAVGGIVSIGSVHAVRSLDRDPGCSCGRWRNRRQRGIDPRLSLGRIESDRVSHAGIGRAPCRVWNNRHICRP